MVADRGWRLFASEKWCALYVFKNLAWRRGLQNAKPTPRTEVVENSQTVSPSNPAAPDRDRVTKHYVGRHNFAICYPEELLRQVLETMVLLVVMFVQYCNSYKFARGLYEISYKSRAAIDDHGGR